MMNKFTRVLGTGMVTMTVVAALSACSSKNGAHATYKKSLNWMTTSEIQTMDQTKMVDTTGGEQATNVFEGLYRLDKDGNVVSAVATEAKQSKDGLTWTFRLRKDARWSNGDPVTANDFVYALQRTLDPKTASQQQHELQAVVNADDVVSGKKSPKSLGVSAKDDHTLVVNLSHPVPYFKTLLSTCWNPVDKKVAEKYGRKFGTASKYNVYNGPFKQQGWTGSNLSWKLEKNDQYWDKKAVKLQTVNYNVQKTPSTDYNLYQSGKLDGALLDVQASKQLKHQNGYHVFKLDRTEYLTYNLSKNKDLANVNLRRALSMTLDRQNLAKTVGAANTVAKTFAGPNEKVGNVDFVSYVEKRDPNNKYVEHNEVEAKRLFKRALKELGKNQVSFTLGGDDDDVSKKVMEFVQSELESTFGKKLNVNVRSMPKTTRVANMLNGKYDVDYTGLTSGYLDPYSMLHTMMTGENYNFGKWSSRKFNQYMKASDKQMNTTKRLQDLYNGERVLMDQQPLSPLFHDGQAWMVRSGVHDLEFDSGNFNFRNAYVLEK